MRTPAAGSPEGRTARPFSTYVGRISSARNPGSTHPPLTRTERRGDWSNRPGPATEACTDIHPSTTLSHVNQPPSTFKESEFLSPPRTEREATGTRTFFRSTISPWMTLLTTRISTSGGVPSRKTGSTFTSNVVLKCGRSAATATFHQPSRGRTPSNVPSVFVANGTDTRPSRSVNVTRPERGFFPRRSVARNALDERRISRTAPVPSHSKGFSSAYHPSPASVATRRR
jgi:hypothetical protein